MPLPAYSAAETSAALNAIGTSFASLRPRVTQVALNPPVTTKDLNRSLVVHAVADAAAGASVGEVADRMNVDASVASRLVADCIDAGLNEAEDKDHTTH